MRDVDVVISGIGAAFPGGCGSVQEFGRALLDNKHLPTATSRWKYDESMDVAEVCGQIPIDRFDDGFYGINRWLARDMDPITKLGLQRSFEAVIDAGLHPHALRGGRVNVYGGSGVSEFEQQAVHSSSLTAQAGHVIAGISRTMLPNRISHFFDFKGSSCSTDGSWPMAHAHVQAAAEAIRGGDCEAALLVAANVARFPNVSALLLQLGLVNGEGVTRCFDEAANGTVRSDSAVAIFIQRGDRAKRCYAKVLAAGMEYVGRGSCLDPTVPSPRGMERFLTDFYRSHDIDPRRIAYLEADGSAHPIRDELELGAVDAALVKGAGRTCPLLVGSVRSNLGNTDAVSGHAAICKAVVALETSTVPATINHRKANPRIRALAEDRLRVATANTPLQLAADGVVAVSTLGLSGCLGHTVLAANPRAPEHDKQAERHLPRLVTLAARTEEGAKEVARKVAETPFDVNYIRLVQDVFSPNIRGYDYRTYVVLPTPAGGAENVPVARMEKRTVWFVYSGMGSQWAGCGAALMRLPVFAETIERLHAVLERKGLDLKHILTETGPEAFDNILKSFVAITACQIALTNVLLAVGVTPDGIIGHSLGEQVCAYVDGCLTEEQAILGSWARGVSSNEASMPKGMMAAIGLGYRQVLPRLPPSVDVACRNSDSSCTLSGPADDVKAFVAELSAEGVFARAVNVADIAFHSRYIQPVATLLRPRLQEVITTPRRRSAKWVSTSVPEEKWGSELATYCSAHYQVNNLESPVLFEEGLAHVPRHGATLVEIAPHGLMQAILKRAVPDAAHVSLTQRGVDDPLRFLLAAIGKLSFSYAAPNAAALYPDVALPVPRGTPSLASLVTWQPPAAETRDMFVEMKGTKVPDLVLRVETPAMTVLGLRLLPLADCLMVMWKNACEASHTVPDAQPTTFSDVHVAQWRPLPCTGTEELSGAYMRGVSHVEITDRDGARVVAGAVVLEVEPPPSQPLPPLPARGPRRPATLTGDKVYEELAGHGLQYDSKYRNIATVRMDEQDWLITAKHNGSWACLLETIGQIYILRSAEEMQALELPARVRRLELDPSRLRKDTDVELRLNLASGVLAGEGVRVSGVSTAPCPAALLPTPLALQFVPFGETSHRTLLEFLRVVAVAMQHERPPLTVARLPNDSSVGDLHRVLADVVRATTGVQPRDGEVAAEAGPAEAEAASSLLVAGPDALAAAERCLARRRVRALLLRTRERYRRRAGPEQPELAVLAEQSFPDGWVTLVGRAAAATDVVQLAPGSASIPADFDESTVVVCRGLDDEKVHEVTAAVAARPTRPRLVFVPEDAPPFSAGERLYADQLARGPPVSILGEGGLWGCWLTQPLPRPGVPGAAVGAPLDYIGEADGKVVMGVEFPGCRRDPLLRWPLPRGWPRDIAAAAPSAYALAYFMVLVKAAARRGESVLVHDGASAVGQATIRVATHLGCSPIFASAKDAEQRELLLKTFPQLEPPHVLPASGSFDHRVLALTGGRGVRVVVSLLPHRELPKSMRCLAYDGRLVHYNQEAPQLLERRHIGLGDFLRSIGAFGVSARDLLLASEQHRAMVYAAVADGLRDGVVKPIVVAKADAAPRGPPDSAAGQHCDPNKSYLVVGADAGRALSVASRLALLGAGHVLLAVRAAPDDAALQRRQRALRRQRAAQPQVQLVPRWDAAAARRLVDAAQLPLQAAVLIDESEEVALLVAGVLPAEARLVLLSELSHSAYRLAGLTARCSARCSGPANTTCMVAPLAAAVRHLPSLVAGAHGPAATAALVVVMSGGALPEAGVELQLRASLPISASALREVWRAAGRCGAGRGRASGPRLRPLRSLAVPGAAPREVQPLYVLPPLAVLDPASGQQLAELAARVTSPVYVVETTVQDGIRKAAEDIVGAVLRRQPYGPYNILGWRLGTVLALEVQRQLEAAGRCGALLLAHGGVLAARQWARACPPERRVLEAVPEAVPESDADAHQGARVVAGLLQAVAEHESDCSRPFAWNVYVVRTSVEDAVDFNENDPRLQTLVPPTPRLADVINYVNQHVGHSQLAGDADLRISTDSAHHSRRPVLSANRLAESIN